MHISDGDTFVFKGNQNDSRQKSLFGKKPEFHSTANNVSTSVVDIFLVLSKITCYQPLCT